MQRTPSESSPRDRAAAFAPATVANVCAGFDVLGFALDGPGDRVDLRIEREGHRPGVVIERVEGVVTDLPTDPARNTAAVALAALLEATGLHWRCRVSLHKGIPLGSGMGGSAASAVAAVVAANALLDPPLAPEVLLRFAAAGEAAASGTAHADNIAPSLLGGVTVLVGASPPRAIALPLPQGVICVLIHPRIRIDTREARAALPRQIPLGLHVEQSMRLAGFLAGCFRGDLGLLGDSMFDGIAEPVRAARIPGFAAARDVARDAGAFAFGIAGSGPSVFAWTADATAAPAIDGAVRAVFGRHGIDCDSWIAPLGAVGARPVAPYLGED